MHRASPTGPDDLPFAPAWDALAPARTWLAQADPATLRTQVTLAGIAAPTFAEASRGRWVAARLRAAGLSVTTDDAGNVRAWRPGASPDAAAVVVAAHLDTVFPAETDLRVQHDGPRLVGAGIGDNARGLAAMLAMAEALARTPLRTRRAICFAATTGEEGVGDLRGARHLFATLERPADAAIIVDGPGDDRIVTQAVGSRRFRLDFHGAGGHSWADFGTPNAVHAAARCAARLAAIPLPRQPRATVTIGRIGGGTSVTAIAADAWLEVDVRATHAAGLDQLVREVQRAADAAVREERAAATVRAAPLTVALSSLGERPCGHLDDAHPLARAARDATLRIGRVPVAASASTDANVPLSLGIPAVAIGAGGRGGGAHTPDEWYENVQGAQGIARALGVVVAAAGLAAD